MKSTRLLNHIPIKSGQYVIFGEHTYLFLGYCDDKLKRCVIADSHGNKVETFSSLISKKY